MSLGLWFWLVVAALAFILGWSACLVFARCPPPRRTAPPKGMLANGQIGAHLSRPVIACQACAEEYAHQRYLLGQSLPEREIIPNGDASRHDCELCGCARARYRLRLRLGQ